MPTGQHLGSEDFRGIFHVDPHHLGPRRHKGADGPLVQSQHAFNHVLFRLLENAQGSALFNEDFDLFRRDVRFRRELDPAQTERQVCGYAEQPNKR